MCVESHTRGQLLRQQGKLLESRTELLSCSAAECPGVIRRDCVHWLEQLQPRIPSIGFRASMAGEERVDVKVFIDGVLVLERLQGKALEFNPGVYRLRFVTRGPIAPVEQELVVSEGDQLRVLTVEFTPPPAPPAPSSPEAPLERPTTLATYVFAGLGTAAAINGAAWGLSSWAAMGELDSSCAPLCTEKTVDVARRRALIADVSFAVSAASFITAGVLYLVRPDAPRSDPAIDVALLDGGLLGSVELVLP
jgi:hypothetical protein